MPQQSSPTPLRRAGWLAGRALAVLAFTALAGRVAAQQMGELGSMVPSDPVDDSRFGQAVALDGDTAAIGAPWHNMAYVYQRQAGTWGEQARIAYPGSFSHAEFGHAVALEGDTLVVGAWRDGAFSQGQAYVYTRSAGVWSLATVLGASRPRVEARFGSAVALLGSTAVIGASRDNGGVPSSGAVYVFEGAGSSWTEVQRLTAPSPHSDNQFGSSLQLTSDRLLVGMEVTRVGTAPHPGSVHLFARVGAAWTLEARFVDADPSVDYWTGSLDGDRIALTAIEADNQRGSVRIQERGPGGWSETARLLPHMSQFHDSFGLQVVLVGDRLFASTRRHELNRDRGAVYLFRRHGELWAEEQWLIAADGSVYDAFGRGLAYDQGELLIGDPSEGVPGFLTGKAYVFGEVASPPGPSLLAVSPGTVEALLPGTERTVTLAGNRLDLATVLTLDGVPIEPARTTRVDDRLIRLDMPQASRRGTLTLAVSDGVNTTSQPITVTVVAAPRLEVGSGDPGQVIDPDAGLSFRLAGTPRLIQAVYASTRLVPSISPQVSLAIGDGFTALCRGGWYVIPNRGWLQVDLTPSRLSDPALIGLTFHVQSFELDGATPWPVSNVQSIQLGP